MHESSVDPPFRSITFDTLGSTNQEGLERARAGDPGRLWLRALVQTQGRGRVGRSWSSPSGNLHISLLLVDPSEAKVVAQLGFVAGVALCRSVRRIGGVGTAVRLKWPNDLVHDGAKLAGILVEGCQRPDGTFACVIGFGVNCTSHPSGLDYPTTDLMALTGARCSADDLACVLQREMAEAIALWARGSGFPALRQIWLDLALERGAPLKVKSMAAATDGFFDTIDDLGRLRLTTASGVLTVDAADVFAVQPPSAVGGG